MLKERNERSTQTDDLVRRNVHVFHVASFEDREVACLTGNDLLFHEISFVIKRGVRLRNLCSIFFFSAQVSELLHVHLAIAHLPVRGFNETHFIDLRMHAKRGDKTDVRTFRCFNRTKTTVVRIVYVTHLKACTLPAQTTGTERRYTTLVGDLRQRVRLVEELR